MNYPQLTQDLALLNPHANETFLEYFGLNISGYGSVLIHELEHARRSDADNDKDDNAHGTWHGRISTNTDEPEKDYAFTESHQLVSERILETTIDNTDFVTSLVRAWAQIPKQHDQEDTNFEGKVDNADNNYSAYIAFMTSLFMQGGKVFEAQVQQMLAKLGEVADQANVSSYTSNMLSDHEMPMSCIRLLMRFVHHKDNPPSIPDEYVSESQVAAFEAACSREMPEFLPQSVHKNAMLHLARACRDLELFGLYTIEDSINVWQPANLGNASIWIKYSNTHWVAWDTVDKIKAFEDAVTANKHP